MANKIKFKRGASSNLPTLDVGEPALVTDAGSEKLYIGSSSGNIQLAREDELPSPATATPNMDGTASKGSSSKYALEDHVHPTDTSRAPVSHSHDASDIASGTLDSARLPTVPLTKGGTGQTTAAKGLYALINGSAPTSSAYVADNDCIGVSDVSATTGKRLPISELKTLLSGAKIAFGTYNGTGTHGSTNPTSLTFDFEPKLLWVTKNGFIESTHKTSSTTADYLNLQMFLINGVTSASLNNGTTATGTVTITWSGNTVSWYSSSAILQLNSGNSFSPQSYYYLAIG